MQTGRGWQRGIRPERSFFILVCMRGRRTSAIFVASGGIPIGREPSLKQLPGISLLSCDCGSRQTSDCAKKVPPSLSTTIPLRALLRFCVREPLVPPPSFAATIVIPGTVSRPPFLPLTFPLLLLASAPPFPRPKVPTGSCLSFLPPPPSQSGFCHHVPSSTSNSLLPH